MENLSRIKNNTLSVEQVATALNRDRQTIRYLIDHGMVGWGMSFNISKKRKTYIIFREKFEQETGIRFSEQDIGEEREADELER